MNGIAPGSALEPLWPGGAPRALGHDELDRPAISLHLPDPSVATGTAIVVNPGGGYRSLASDHEGLQVARWLNRLGIAAAVLRYRLGPRYHSSVSLLDAQRAIRMLRHRATGLAIDPRRIGMLGFSAGGHLALRCATAPGQGQPGADDPIERHNCRPDFVVPLYAVVNGRLRGRKPDEYLPAEMGVDASTPPAFVVHTHEDSVVRADQSLLFYQACLQAGVPAELHVFGHGEHGVGLAIGDPDVHHWTGLLHRWLRRRALLTGAPRIAVRGTANLDGRVPGMAWITLVPLDPNAPIARVRIGADQLGRFEIGAAHGPVAGPHRIALHVIGEQSIYGGDGAYSIDDAHCHELQAELHAGEPLTLRFSSPGCPVR